MELLIHVGTNKTGSSFLQTVLTSNRKQLENQRVYVPASAWDAEMLVGKISPGNGHQLATLISRQDKKGLCEYLKKLYTEAKKRKCEKVVLSNEILIRILSYENELNLLVNVAKETGFQNISWFYGKPCG